ncbi:hypothetical protein C8Q80DRAFT_158322 [Daedaleopsis nitida]|nr:hypothetical protein C8Q80DRAFT_158322 [Daedaleopsis nitida]
MWYWSVVILSSTHCAPNTMALLRRMRKPSVAYNYSSCLDFDAYKATADMLKPHRCNKAEQVLLTAPARHGP